HQLQLIGSTLGGSYVLGANINLSSALSNVADVWTGISNGGFMPIGDSTRNFTGSINGAGYAISNLTINRPTFDSAGFISWNTGTIQNLALINASITGRDTVGGFVGDNRAGATITNSYITGIVSGNSRVGGIAGASEGAT